MNEVFKAIGIDYFLIYFSNFLPNEEYYLVLVDCLDLRGLCAGTWPSKILEDTLLGRKEVMRPA